MTFPRFFTLVSAALASISLSHASITQSTVVSCLTGQKTANWKCCSLFPIVEMIQKDLFDGGQCDEDAHEALRLSFHDAIGFSTNGGKGGGADGSILVFESELKYAGNAGIDEVVARQLPVFRKSGLSAGDFIHLAAAIGTSNCPGAPRLKFFSGRPAPTAPAPDLTVSEAKDSVTQILARFADAGFNPQETVALLASHSIAALKDPGEPFDSTVGIFDTQVFLDVLLTGRTGNNVSDGEFRLQSDFEIARDNRTACAWQSMINNQNTMMEQFKTVMEKMQLLGQDEYKLSDCSDVIPKPQEYKGYITYPPGFSQKDVQISCDMPFPNVATASGAMPTVAPTPVPERHTSLKLTELNDIKP